MIGKLTPGWLASHRSIITLQMSMLLYSIPQWLQKDIQFLQTCYELGRTPWETAPVMFTLIYNPESNRKAMNCLNRSHITKTLKLCSQTSFSNVLNKLTASLNHVWLCTYFLHWLKSLNAQSPDEEIFLSFGKCGAQQTSMGRQNDTGNPLNKPQGKKGFW